MVTLRTALSCAVFAGFLLSQNGPANASDVLAGTGAAGIDDGPAAASTFAKPVALGYGSGGSLYIVDQGAQRIRVLRGGVVRTVAGSGSFTARNLVAGGYADGPALTARFFDPSGIAVGHDGALYVADTGNHCIRKIYKGIVTTVAGGPDRTGAKDGPGASASFALPTAITVDGSDGFFIADLNNGVRHMTRSGVVSSVSIPRLGPSVRGVSVFSKDGRAQLAVAERSQIAFYDLDTKTPGLVGSNPSSEERFGTPASILAIGFGNAVYADLTSRALRYETLQVNGPFGNTHSEPLLKPTRMNAEYSAANYSAGSPVPFIYPAGLALAPGGRLAVADMGARKIRMLPAVDQRQSQSGNLADMARTDNSYRIAYVANSFAYYNVDWNTSVPGVIEATLNRDRAKLGLKQPVRVLAYKLAPGSIKLTGQYISDVLSEGLVDDVVWSFNTGHLLRELQERKWGLDDVSKWKPMMTDLIGSLNRDLRSKKVPMLIALQPLVDEASWTEGHWGGADIVFPGAFGWSDELRMIGGNVRGALRAGRVPYVDLFPQVWAYEDGAERSPLFGTWDGHPSRAGNVLIGKLIAAELEKEKPWKNSK